MTDQRLLCEKEAAQVLGVAPSTLNFWRVQGRGPAFIRLSARCVRYRISDLAQYVESQRVVGPEARRLEPVK